MDGLHSSLDAELASFPLDILGEAKLWAGFGDREAQSLNAGEKVCDRLPSASEFLTHRRFSRSKASYSMLCGSSKAYHPITVLEHPPEPTCTGHCKI